MSRYLIRIIIDLFDERMTQKLADHWSLFIILDEAPATGEKKRRQREKRETERERKKGTNDEYIQTSEIKVVGETGKKYFPLQKKTKSLK